MVKVIVVYESKYGNTKRVAETIIEGINKVGGIEASVSSQRRKPQKPKSPFLIHSSQSKKLQ